MEGENELVAYSMRSMSSESGVLEQRSVETGSGISEPGVSMELSNYLDSALPEQMLPPRARNSLFVSLGDVNYETDEARIKAYMIRGCAVSIAVSSIDNAIAIVSTGRVIKNESSNVNAAKELAPVPSSGKSASLKRGDDISKTVSNLCIHKTAGGTVRR